MTRKLTLLSGGALLLFAGLIYGEQRSFALRIQDKPKVIAPESTVLQPAPIRSDWVLEGRPVAKAAIIASTDDGSTKVAVWQTSAGRFNWIYDFDEVVHVLDGEVFLTDSAGVERRAGAGDVIFFPAGAKVMWRVPDHIRKIATMKNVLPKPVASALRLARAAKAAVSPTQAFAD